MKGNRNAMLLTTTIALALLLAGSTLSRHPESFNYDPATLIPESRQGKINTYLPLPKRDHHLRSSLLTSFHPLKITAETSGLEWIKGKMPKMYTFLIQSLIPSVI